MKSERTRELVIPRSSFRVRLTCEAWAHRPPAPQRGQRSAFAHRENSHLGSEASRLTARNRRPPLRQVPMRRVHDPELPLVLRRAEEARRLGNRHQKLLIFPLGVRTSGGDNPVQNVRGRRDVQVVPTNTPGEGDRPASPVFIVLSLAGLRPSTPQWWCLPTLQPLSNWHRAKPGSLENWERGCLPEYTQRVGSQTHLPKARRRQSSTVRTDW
jgi:hypothetical protein